MDKEKFAIVIKDLTISFGMVFTVYLLLSKNLAGNIIPQTWSSDVILSVFYYHIGAAEIWLLIFFVKKLSLLGFVLQILVVDRLIAVLPVIAENGIVKLVPTNKLMLVGIVLYWLFTWLKIKKDLK